jgi:hypothetical protein
VTDRWFAAAAALRYSIIIVPAPAAFMAAGIAWTGRAYYSRALAKIVE